MKITVCIGSSCHLKGSRQIVESLQERIASDGLTDKIELCGTFCLGDCQNDVSIKIDEELFSVSPEGLDAFYKEQVLARL